LGWTCPSHGQAGAVQPITMTAITSSANARDALRKSRATRPGSTQAATGEPGEWQQRTTAGDTQARCPRAADHASPACGPGRVEFSLTDEEFGEQGAAAARAGLAMGAYAAEAALSVARGVTSSADSAFREALGEFVRAAGLVRRIGVNLNQAVAKLNATGQRSGELLPYAAESVRRAEQLDAAAEEIRKSLEICGRAHDLLVWR
jgi:hypothetical protein